MVCLPPDYADLEYKPLFRVGGRRSDRLRTGIVYAHLPVVADLVMKIPMHINELDQHGSLDRVPGRNTHSPPSLSHSPAVARGPIHRLSSVVVPGRFPHQSPPAPATTATPRGEHPTAGPHERSPRCPFPSAPGSPTPSSPLARAAHPSTPLCRHDPSSSQESEPPKFPG
jgi:hypothetical protein